MNRIGILIYFSLFVRIVGGVLENYLSLHLDHILSTIAKTTNIIYRGKYRQTFFRKMPFVGTSFATGPIIDPPITLSINIKILAKFDDKVSIESSLSCIIPVSARVDGAEVSKFSLSL